MRYTRRQALFLGLAAVLLLSFHSLSFHSLFPQQNHSSFEVPITYDETQVRFNVSGSVVTVGKEYSARACWLDPAWGIADQSKKDVCIGAAPAVYATSAPRLTCRDKPANINTNRSHDGVTIALLYFAKPAMLFHQLQNFASYPDDVKQQLTILIIDDGSPEGLRATDYLPMTTASDYYDSHFRLRLRFARITTEKSWNIGGARNLAFYLVDTPRVLLLDLDMMVPLETMKAALTWKTRNETNVMAHRFNRRRPSGGTAKHPAVALLDAAAYWESGGCDEDFCGHYGFTDVHFWYRWKRDTTRLQLDHMSMYLVEFDQEACNSTFIATDEKKKKCEDARAALQPTSKDLDSNRAKLKRKRGDGCWSNRYLRFRWVLES